MGMTKVTRNYQITLPKDAREIAGIKIGDTILVDADKDGLRVRKMSARSAILDSAGIFSSVSDSVAYVRKLRDAAEERRKRLGL